MMCQELRHIPQGNAMPTAKMESFAAVLLFLNICRLIHCRLIQKLLLSHLCRFIKSIQIKALISARRVYDG